MQPLHWHLGQNKHKMCQKVPKSTNKKNGSKRGGFSSTICTRQESQCLPYAGVFGLLPSASLVEIVEIDSGGGGEERPGQRRGG